MNADVLQTVGGIAGFIGAFAGVIKIAANYFSKRSAERLKSAGENVMLRKAEMDTILGMIKEHNEQREHLEKNMDAMRKESREREDRMRDENNALRSYIAALYADYLAMRHTLKQTYDALAVFAPSVSRREYPPHDTIPPFK